MTIKSKKSKRGGRRPGAGRKKGVPNKLTFELKEAAAKHGDESLKAILNVLRDAETPPNVVVMAAKELLDRGFGKPAQEIDVNADFKFNKDFLISIENTYVQAMKKSRDRQIQVYRERTHFIGENLAQELIEELQNKQIEVGQ
jgi:hypothetical protein